MHRKTMQTAIGNDSSGGTNLASITLLASTSYYLTAGAVLMNTSINNGGAACSIKINGTTLTKQEMGWPAGETGYWEINELYTVGVSNETATLSCGYLAGWGSGTGQTYGSSAFIVAMPVGSISRTTS